ncbi:MAG: ArnT family glycosyltransferase [Rhodospirillaceae bacterium]
MSASILSSQPADLQAPSFIDKFASGGLRPYLILSVLCALLYLPGLASIPPTDRDEARFMQATKQMIETGDYIHIHFQDEPRNKKPAGIHWLQTAAVKIAGRDLSTYWPYRIPSVLAAWLAVMGSFAFARRVSDAATGFTAAGILATSLMVVIEAHIAKTDATLLAATTVAMGALAVMYVRREGARFAVALALWSSLAVGTLVKGPVSLMVVLLTIAALGIADRGVRWLKQARPLIGLPLLLALTLPWLLASSNGGGSAGGNNFIVEAVRGDLIPKLIGGQESHGAFPGTHTLASLITFWPWSLLAPFALVLGWRRRAEPSVRFCLAWLVGTWVMFELVPTKLPHYTLPTFPALALLTAIALRSNALQDLMGTMSGRIYRGLWAAVTFALGGGIIFAAQEYGGDIAMAGMTALILAAGAALALATWANTRTIALAGVVAAAFAAFLAGGLIPSLNDLAISTRLAGAIAQHRTSTQSPIAMAGYSEPSAVFLLGTDTILTSTASVTDYLLSHPGAIGVIEAEHLDAVTRSVAGTGGAMRKLADIEGYNYSRGDPVALSVITITAREMQP